MLYTRYSGAVLASCLRELGDRGEAEDVVQETFLNAWLALRRGVEPEAPLAWLITIARNLCVSRHRARHARVETLPFDEARHPLTARADSADDLLDLTPLLRRLPERQRQAFLLREIRGLSYGEVAAEIGLSYTAVATLAFRARRTLARELAEGETVPGKKWGWGSLLGMLEPMLGGQAAVQVGAAVAVVPLVLLPSAGAPKLPARVPAHVSESRSAPARVQAPATSATLVRIVRSGSAERVVATRRAPSRLRLAPAVLATPPAATVGPVRPVSGSPAPAAEAPPVTTPAKDAGPSPPARATPRPTGLDAPATEPAGDRPAAGRASPALGSRSPVDGGAQGQGQGQGKGAADGSGLAGPGEGGVRRSGRARAGQRPAGGSGRARPGQRPARGSRCAGAGERERPAGGSGRSGAGTSRRIRARRARGRAGPRIRGARAAPRTERAEAASRSAAPTLRLRLRVVLLRSLPEPGEGSELDALGLDGRPDARVAEHP